MHVDQPRGKMVSIRMMAASLFPVRKKEKLIKLLRDLVVWQLTRKLFAFPSSQEHAEQRENVLHDDEGASWQKAPSKCWVSLLVCCYCEGPCRVFHVRMRTPAKGEAHDAAGMWTVSCSNQCVFLKHVVILCFSQERLCMYKEDGPGEGGPDHDRDWDASLLKHVAISCILIKARVH